MRKKLIFIFLVLLFVALKTVHASERFVEAEYVSGEYINAVRGNLTRYQTVRVLRDLMGNHVYCIQPFVDFNGSDNFIMYPDQYSDYNDLTLEQKRRVLLIAYFGYGYKERIEQKWYAITQYLIWTTIESTDNIYFTDTLNGRRITKYESEMNEILNDVIEYDATPSFARTYQVEYGSNLTIENIDSSYYIQPSQYEYVTGNNNITISNITSSGSISFSKKSEYKSQSAFYDSTSSQDLIKPGSVYTYNKKANIEVINGRIKLNLIPENSVYTVESSIENTCFNVINSSGNVVDTGCFTDDNLTYETKNLPFGKYKIQEKSMGKGYEDIEGYYEVELTSSRNYIEKDINIKQIKNKIEINKYACKDNQCTYESNAEFIIKDKYDNIVDRIITNELGQAISIAIGYGTYKVEQVKGIEDYTLIESYNEEIIDSKTPHKKNLFNYYKTPETEIVEDEPVIPIPEPEEDILPPDTGLQASYGIVGIISLLTTIITISFIIRKRT